MQDSYDDNAVDVGLSLDLIEEEVRAGLPMHADRLCEAFLNEEYYHGRNAAYVPRRESEEWTDYVRRPRRTSKVTRKVVHVLTRDLYSPGPTRTLENGAAEDGWLQGVYASNRVNALLQQADRKATLNGLAAVQATATGRGEKPIQLTLWGAHELVWWTWPDDPTEAWAVATIARERRIESGTLQERLRIEVWSRDEHRYYMTKWVGTPTQGTPSACYRSLFGQPATYIPQLSGVADAGGRGDGRNPYGVLPFAFVHDELPVTRLDEGGIGTMVREANAEVDRELSDLAQVVQKHMAPDAFLTGVSVNWRREKRVGGWQRLVPGKDAEGEAAVEPKAFYAQPTLEVDAVWGNSERYLNSTLEECDVPLTAVRADASMDASGIAIVAKQLPLLSRTRQRQMPFTACEEGLATMVLTVAGNFYSEPRLVAAAQATTLCLVWPEPAFPLPTPERDAADTFEMQNHIKSLVMVVAERLGVTADQAKEHLERVKEDNAWLQSILPPAPAGPNADPNTPAPTTGDDPTQDPEEV